MVNAVFFCCSRHDYAATVRPTHVLLITHLVLVGICAAAKSIVDGMAKHAFRSENGVNHVANISPVSLSLSSSHRQIMYALSNSACGLIHIMNNISKAYIAGSSAGE